MEPQVFIDLIKNDAVKLYNDKGIRASLSIAQACLETGFGKYIPKDSCNIFGLKWTKPSDGLYIEKTAKEYIAGKLVTKKIKLRKYNSFDECFTDYAEFLLKNKRYNNVLIATTSTIACYEIEKAGYATDPQYAEKLIKIINEYKLDELDVKDAQDIEVIKMKIIIIDKEGVKHELNLDQAVNIKGHIYLEGRTLAKLIGAKARYVKKTNTATFDFS